MDRQGNTIGTFIKGQQVTLHSIGQSKGIIDFLGKQVYVNLHDFQHTNQILPKKHISYGEMEYHLHVLSLMYPEFTKLEKVGFSVEGRTIYAFKVGTGKKEVLFDAAIHAREHMTTNVLLEMIDEYTKCYTNGTKLGEFPVKEILDTVSIWFIPMMNPDGVNLVQSNFGIYNSFLISINNSVNFKRWKANIRGVDLNRNFDAAWHELQSPNNPTFKNYKGESPFSEPESLALRDFIKKHKFKSYISYHSSGQVLFYFNDQNNLQLERDNFLTRKIQYVTGYKIMPPRKIKGSGTSTDWFIKNYKQPGITVEISPFVKETEVPMVYWDQIWKKNKTVGLLVAKEASTRSKLTSSN